jgi:hypothetical protein
MPTKKKNETTTDDANLQALVAELSTTPPSEEEILEIRDWMRSQSNMLAIAQIWRAAPLQHSKPSEADRRSLVAGFFGSFLASDGHESALVRLIVAATNCGMDCFARAATSDSLTRTLELNLAIKLSATVALLSKALDSHRSCCNPFQPWVAHDQTGCSPQLPTPKSRRKQ